MVLVKYFKKLYNFINKKLDENFFYVILFMIFIGFLRNLLEIVGGAKSGFSLSQPSLYNTINYVFLMIIAEGYLLNYFFKGNNEKLRSLIHKGLWLLLGLFIIIPLLNIIFNYLVFNLPIYFHLPLISDLLFQHYGPVGIHIAFLIVMFGFPFWLKKFYKSSLLKSFLIVWPFYIVHYFYTYLLAMGIIFGRLMRYTILEPYINHNFLDPIMGILVNQYTATYVIVILIVYPFFMNTYPKNKEEYKKVKLFYYLLWFIFVTLFFFKFPFFTPFEGFITGSFEKLLP